MARDLASFGYIVFCPDHNDRTGTYSKDKDGKEYFFDYDFAMTNMDKMSDRADIRVKEMSAFVDDMSSTAFLQEDLKFPEKLTLKMESLICHGQSFGGGTSLSTCSADKRFRCCISNDAWVMPHRQYVHEKKYNFDVPLLILNSQNYDKIGTMIEGDPAPNTYRNIREMNSH
jgi:dienelactone hydrolase